MIRLNKTQINYLYRNAQDIKGIVETASDVMFGVCPFTIILGALNTTEAGYKPPNLIVNNYTNFNKVFTGRESILCVWDDCYDLDQVRTPIDKGGDETNNYGIVKVRQYDDGSNGGNRFYGRLTQSAVATSFKPNSANDTMTQMGATKTVSLIFEYKKNERLFDEITNNIYKMWVIPELFKFYDSNNHRYVSTDRQWYYLESCLIIYNAKTKNPEILQATFSSVNDIVAKSGLAIDQYIQINAPGDRCCFPTVDSDGLIVCDKELLKYKPITHAQISFFGNVSFGNIIFMGRPTSTQQPQYEWKIEAPRFVFPHIYQASSYDELFVNAVPETNYYLLYNALPQIITGWNNWKDNISSTYNAFMSKQYEGFIAVDINNTKLTNEDDSVEKGLHYQYWDPRFLQDKSVWPTNKYNVGGSEYYNINPNLQDETIKFDYCGETLILPPSIISDVNYALHTLNIASFFTQKQFYQLPLEITQTTPVAISSFPVIGRFLNILSLGLPFGFRLTSNVLTPRIPAILGLISVEQFELLTAIFSTSAKNNIPFDAFRKDTTSDIYSLCGTTSQTTSFCFNLSNQIVLQPTKIDGTKPNYSDIMSANYNPKTTIDSVKLGQINKEKMEAYLLGGLIDLKKLGVNSGFIIDSFAFQVIGQVPYRITFYSQTDNPQGNLDNKNSVWTGVYKTLSSASQNTRQWTNFMVLSNPQYNFQENFYYPQNATGAPIEGEYNKDLFITVKGIDISNQVAKYKDLTLINKLFEFKHLDYDVELGYSYNLNEDSLSEEVVNFEVDDLNLGLEEYTAKEITLTIEDLKGGIDTQRIITWGSGPTNLSKSGNFWFYYQIIEGEGYPYWAQDPGINGKNFDLTKNLVDNMTFTIDLTNEEEQIIDLTSSSNILNRDFHIITSTDRTVDIYSNSDWSFKGEYLKTYLNFLSSNKIPTGKLTDLYVLNPCRSGVDIYFKEIRNPKLIIKKTRDDKNNKWVISIQLNTSMLVNGNCLLDREDGSPWHVYDWDCIFHNFKYYIDNNQANPTYYYLKGNLLNEKINVKYTSKQKLKNQGINN